MSAVRDASSLSPKADTISRAFRDSLQSVVDVLGAEHSETAKWPPSVVASTRGAAGIAATKAALGRVR